MRFARCTIKENKNGQSQCLILIVFRNMKFDGRIKKYTYNSVRNIAVVQQLQNFRVGEYLLLCMTCVKQNVDVCLHKG